MKKFIKFLTVSISLLLLFSNCSKEDVNPSKKEKATVFFSAVLNDMMENRAATKQAFNEIPTCTNDIPSYVEIILLQNDIEIVGSSGNPFRIDLVSGKVFTEEAPELKFDPGTYILDHFAVYNSDGELIWLAPRGGELGNFVDTPLPLTIELNAGVKKYVDVSVLCFDNRDVNEYGYLFFDLNPHQAVAFCFFANYCNDVGRHFPAAFSVDIWLGTDDSGTVLYSNLENAVSTEGGDPASSPLCVALPDLPEFADDEDYIYYEVNLLDWEGVYGEVNNTVIQGTLSRADIQANFDGDDALEYEHIRFNCTETEGIPQIGNDQCFAEGLDREGSSVESAWLQGSENGFVEASLISRRGIWLGGDEYEFEDRRFSSFSLSLEENNRYMGNVEFSLQDPNHLEVILDVDIEWVINSYVLEVKDALGSEIHCFSLSWRDNEDLLGDEFRIVYELSEEFVAPIYIRFQAGLICGWGCD